MFQLKDAKINSSDWSWKTLLSHDSLHETILISFIPWEFCYKAAECFLSSFCPFNLCSLFPPPLFTPHSVFSYLSRPGPAAPSRSCCLQLGSSSPTPQSSMPLSSPTPWAAHSPSPTGGEQLCFLTFNCSLHCEYCGLRKDIYWRMSFLSSKNKALCEMKFIHITSGTHP